MDNKYQGYINPLSERYSTKEMQNIFSEQTRIGYFRKLWVALAESEKKLGLNISEAQIEELKAHVDDIDFEVAKQREKIVRHDVMAHVYAYGMQCKSAMPIIHLGATSCYVTDNADLIIYKKALGVVAGKLAAVMARLKNFALKYKDLPTLGFTHYQPAQLVTVGKRAALWLQDFVFDYNDLTRVKDDLKLRGAKGTTGTQASFLTLFDNDSKKVTELEKLINKYFGFKDCYRVSGQTYSRKIDYKILSALSAFAQSAYKLSMDLRLLQSMKELEEPFESGQIGSSAMAYKRNPMRSERISSLARYLISLPTNAAMTAATQGFERTLDDSANRRIVMAQAFLTADAVLELLLNVTNGIVVYEKVIKRHVLDELPFMATETILMECVKVGGDRQFLHERIREHSMAAEKQFRNGGKRDLIDRLKNDEAFSAIKNYSEILNPKKFIGLAPKQVVSLVTKDVDPILKLNKENIEKYIEDQVKL